MYIVDICVGLCEYINVNMLGDVVFGWFFLGAFVGVLVWSEPWTLFVAKHVYPRSTWAGKLLSCPVCFGFWVGLLAYLPYGVGVVPLLGLASLVSLTAKVAYKIADW